MDKGSRTSNQTTRRADNKRRCPLCSRTFTKTEHLERHIRSHTKEKPFHCEECGKNYSRNDSLLRHIKDAHTETPENHHPAGQNGRNSIASGPSTGGTIDLQLGSTLVPETLEPPAAMTMMQGSNLIGGGLAIDHILSPQNAGTNHQFLGGSDPSWSLTFQPELPQNQDWPTEADFDLAAQYSNLLPLENFDGFLNDWPFASLDQNSEPFTTESGPPRQFNTTRPLADLQNVWHTHLDNVNDQQTTSSGYATPVHSQNQNNEIDDNYRQSLHRRLQIRPVDQVLPSAEYLNLCVKSYFKKFHFVFPIVHVPTFRPSKTNSVLLLSICSIGSLLTGHPSALQRGIQLFERLNKAILTYWEALMKQGPEQSLAMVQAAVIGQTFGLLSGQAKHLALVDAFHGTVISWARRVKLFEACHSELNLDWSQDPKDIESAWKVWVRREEEVRVTLALRIHDAEIANILHHETLLPCAPKKYQAAASDALFLAPSPQEWWSMYKTIASHGHHHLGPYGPASTGSSSTQRDNSNNVVETLQQRFELISENSHFATYAALDDFLSVIMDTRASDSLSIDFIHRTEQILINFHKQHLYNSPSKPFEPLHTCLKILWHFLFIVLHSDLELFERCIGRDGPELKDADVAEVNEWAQSNSSKQCIAHALLIKRLLESLPLSSEPAMHIPKTTFFSSIVLFCYLKYRSGAENGGIVGPGLGLYSFEFKYLNVDGISLMREANIDGSSHVSGSEVIELLLCAQVDLLKRIGHWEISRRFASILETLIHAESP